MHSTTLMSWWAVILPRLEVVFTLLVLLTMAAVSLVAAAITHLELMPATMQWTWGSMAVASATSGLAGISRSRPTVVSTVTVLVPELLTHSLNWTADAACCGLLCVHLVDCSFSLDIVICCEKYFLQKYDSVVALYTSPMFSNRPTKALISSLDVGCHFLALENTFIVFWCSDIYLSTYYWFVSDTKTSDRSLPSATTSTPTHNWSK